MRILILGGNGMLGHQLLASLSPTHEVKVTLHGSIDAYQEYVLFDHNNAYYNVDVLNLNKLGSVLRDFQPDAVINAVGLIKQTASSEDIKANIELNALFPWQLSDLCSSIGARLFQMGTDCVFSGQKGGYTESDTADATDVYGRTKYLGELDLPHTLTLRTSIIGLELSRKKSLIEWFLGASGTIYGYTKAIYSGFTTYEMSNIIDNLLTEHRDLSGVWHVASEPISKYDLLTRLSGRLGRQDVEVIPDDEFVCDRSLNAARFNSAIGYSPPDWDEMIDGLAEQIKSRVTQ